MVRLTVVAIAICAMLSGAAAIADSPGGPKTINDGVYTEAQADAGKALYEQYCLTCHDKKYFRPVFKAWSGQPLSVLFATMSASMPQSNPGSLPRADYVKILAYILSLNRYPAGEAELDYRGDKLDDIAIATRSTG